VLEERDPRAEKLDVAERGKGVKTDALITWKREGGLI